MLSIVCFHFEVLITYHQMILCITRTARRSDVFISVLTAIISSNKFKKLNIGFLHHSLSHTMIIVAIFSFAYE